MSKQKLSLDELRAAEYDLRLEVSSLERLVYEMDELTDEDDLLERLVMKQQTLYEVEQDRAAAEKRNRRSGLIVNAKSESASEEVGGTDNGSPGTRGADTTGLVVKVNLRMAQVPTATCHLFDQIEHPLVISQVRAVGSRKRRVRVISFIEGYTARAVDTVELKPNKAQALYQLPTFFPERIRDLNELTRATLNILVEDLDGKVELHATEPVWLLARNSAPLAVKDPTSGQWNDLTRYLGAFVTPNEPSIMRFQRQIARHHPEGRLVGYQGPVASQAKAIFQALKQDADITYVNSVVDFNPEEGSKTQRVRLPRQSLDEGQANCIDGSLLFASLLEGISLNPAIVIVPKHVMVGWETKSKSGEWNYLETTMINTHSFEKALDSGQRKAKVYQGQLEATGNLQWFRQWSLRELRTKYGITPLE
ncbi:MAG: hypothetical protein AAF702_39955 [Chloroflexota bacterium]